MLDTGVRLTRSGVSHIVLTHSLTLNQAPWSCPQRPPSEVGAWRVCHHQVPAQVLDEDGVMAETVAEESDEDDESGSGTELLKKLFGVF